MYQALHCEVTRLHSELSHQSGLIKKLRPLISETRQGGSHTPTQKENAEIVGLLLNMCYMGLCNDNSIFWIFGQCKETFNKLNQSDIRI